MSLYKCNIGACAYKYGDIRPEDDRIIAHIDIAHENQDNKDNTAICAQCSYAVNPLDLFPENKCLACHMDNAVLPTIAELANMFKNQN